MIVLMLLYTKLNLFFIKISNLFQKLLSYLIHQKVRPFYSYIDTTIIFFFIIINCHLPIIQH